MELGEGIDNRCDAIRLRRRPAVEDNGGTDHDLRAGAPEVGLAARESGKEMPMLLDVLAVVERLAGSTAQPEDR